MQYSYLHAYDFARQGRAAGRSAICAYGCLLIAKAPFEEWVELEGGRLLIGIIVMVSKFELVL